MTPRRSKHRQTAISTRLGRNLVARGLPVTTSRPRKSRAKAVPEALARFLRPLGEPCP